MKETLKELRETLIPIYGKGEAEAIIRILFHYLKGWSLTDMLIHSDDELSPFIKKEIKDILERLKKHEPIQYITGEARFHGMTFKVNRDVLIPRPETDELVDLIITENDKKNDLKVLDICTGSGCIAIALSRNLPFSDITAIDNSAKALDCAKENARILKSKINFLEEDIFSWAPSEKYDIIVSNPPYVALSEALKMDPNVLEYEPSSAIFVTDEKPLVFYDRIGDIAIKSLNPGGKLYLEINPLYTSELEKLLLNKGLRNISIVKDTSGKDRFLTCIFQPKE